MKKILLVATVLVGGVALSQAGVSISIGIGLPFPPLPGLVIRQPAPLCPPPVYVAPPICPPRIVVPCQPIRYQPPCGPVYYQPGHGNWNRHYHGNHRDNGRRY